MRSSKPSSDRSFIRTVLGWQVRRDGAITREDRHVARWTPPAAELRPGRIPQPRLVAFHVENTHAAALRALALGAIANDAGPGVLTDPTGAVFAIRGVSTA